jgi:hypothetical protein
VKFHKAIQKATACKKEELIGGFVKYTIAKIYELIEPEPKMDKEEIVRQLVESVTESRQRLVRVRDQDDDAATDKKRAEPERVGLLVQALREGGAVSPEKAWKLSQVIEDFNRRGWEFPSTEAVRIMMLRRPDIFQKEDGRFYVAA